MTSGSPGSVSSRHRVGLAVLALGLGLLFFAWVSWLYRTSNPDVALPAEVETQSSIVTPAQPGSAPRSDQRAALVQAAPMLLLVTFLLVLVFLVGSFILVRGIRRHLAAGDHQRGPPTPTDDVWSMHRVRDDSDDRAA